MPSIGSTNPSHVFKDMQPNLFFKMFSNCIVSAGANRSLILDLQRDLYLTIPDTMNEVIDMFNDKRSVREVYDFYGSENEAVINEYLDFLTQHNLGFFSGAKEYDRFTAMDKTFETPFEITNCIVEISDKTRLHFDRIIDQLESVNCNNLQLICYNELELQELKYYLQKTAESNFRSIELILKYSDKVFYFINEIDYCNQRVTKLLLHGAADKNKGVDQENLSFTVSFLDHSIDNFGYCGVVDKKYFNINRDKVLESLSHNSCLNKKLTIDHDGNIKNCPSINHTYGNIATSDIQNAIKNPNFKKYWDVSKDQISVCKDCEYRHICTDCRAFVEDPEDEYSKPLKCGYSPYTNDWQEWSTNPLKQKAIDFYGIRELVKKVI